MLYAQSSARGTRHIGRNNSTAVERSWVSESKGRNIVPLASLVYELNQAGRENQQVVACPTISPSQDARGMGPKLEEGNHAPCIWKRIFGESQCHVNATATTSPLSKTAYKARTPVAAYDTSSLHSVASESRPCAYFRSGRRELNTRTWCRPRHRSGLADSGSQHNIARGVFRPRHQRNILAGKARGWRNANTRSGIVVRILERVQLN